MTRRTKRAPDELGAHVSAAGGVALAPARAAELGSVVLQLFTKQPQRWADPPLPATEVAAFRDAREHWGIRFAAAHDSYLINLATSDPTLRARSKAAFHAELTRAAALKLDALVTHPGNATGGDRADALARNAAALEETLAAVPGPLVLLETTAGAGQSLGATFEELAALIDRIAPALRPRVGICMDTCHVFAAGYDLRDDYDAVIARFDDVLGLDRLRLLHLNDSVGTLGSRRDRHAHIGTAALGPEPFRRIVRDDRLRDVPKVIETPKDGDALAADRANLRRLRRYRLHKGSANAQKGARNGARRAPRR